MSDCFDHCLDAYEDLYARGYEDSDFGYFGRTLRNSRYIDLEDDYAPSSYVRPKPTYNVHKFVRRVYETEKAELFSDGENEYWIPKSLIRHSWNIEGKKRPVRVEVDSKFTLTKAPPTTLWS